MRRLSSLLAALAMCAACSDGAKGADEDLIDLFSGELVEEARDRVVVAEVNGVEVYDDCVQAQAEAHDLSVDDALAECIDFELLAAEANRRGLAPAKHQVDDEVVRSFIDREFKARFQDPSQLPQDKLRERYEGTRRPEYRYVTHALAKLPHVEPDDPREIGLAKLMGGLAESLEGRTGVTPEQFKAAAMKVSSQLHVESYNFPRHRRAVEEFSKPVFAMDESEVGTTIGPIRTEFGWHVILLEKILPVQSYDEWAENTFGELRKRAFEQWANSFVNKHSVEIDEDLLPELVAAQEADEMTGGAR